MVRRGVWLLAVLAVAGLIALALAPGHRASGRPSVPEVQRSPSSACFAAHGRCLMPRCVEFASGLCDRYPNPGSQHIYIRR